MWSCGGTAWQMPLMKQNRRWFNVLLPRRKQRSIRIPRASPAMVPLTTDVKRMPSNWWCDCWCATCDKNMEMIHEEPWMPNATVREPVSRRRLCIFRKLPGQAQVPKPSSKPSLQKDQEGGQVRANLKFGFLALKFAHQTCMHLEMDSDSRWFGILLVHVLSKSRGCCLSTRFLMGYDKMFYHAQKLDVRVAISLLQSFGMPVPSTRWRSKMI